MSSDRLTMVLVALLAIAIAAYIVRLKRELNGRDAAVIATAVSAVAIFVYYLQSKEKTTEPLMKHIHRQLMLLDPAANGVFLVEGNRSFTRNKKMISLCTRRADGTLYSMNDLMTVAIHELAHVKFVGDSSDHPDTWDRIFRELIDTADQMGLIDKNDPVEENYCGT